MGIKAAIIKALGGEVKASRVASLLPATNLGGVQWSPARYDVFSREAYIKNVIAYRAIKVVADSVASVPWTVTDLDNQPIEDHPMLSLIARPNPDEGWYSFMVRLISFLSLSGNTFVERVMPFSNEGSPLEMYVHRPDRIEIKLNKQTGAVDAYVYNTGMNKVVFEVDPITLQGDMLQIRTFHPLNDFWGLAGTQPASRSIDTNNEADEWNMNLIRNQGKPGMLFSFPGMLDVDTFDRLTEALRTNHAGGANAGKDLILDQGATAIPLGLSLADLDFMEGGRETARRICLGYGVPPMLLGIPGDNTYSNYKEARLAFWEETVFGLLNLIDDELNNWLFVNEDNAKIAYVLDDIPALADKRQTLWDRAKSADFLTINEKREMVGFDSVGPAGDVILTPATMVPLGFEEDDEDFENTPDDEEPMDDEEDDTEEEDTEE